MSDAGVKRLARLGMVDNAPGMSALDMNTAEDMIVRNTREVVPGMIICGMEVSLNPFWSDQSSPIFTLLVHNSHSNSFNQSCFVAAITHNSYAPHTGIKQWFSWVLYKFPFLGFV